MDQEQLDQEPDWRKDALCKGITSLFYREDPVGIVIAKTYCKRCPIEGACLIEALRNRELYGVWGGKTPRERRRLIPYFTMISSGVSSSHGMAAAASH